MSKTVIVIPRVHRSFARCLEALLQTPQREAYQSELKRLVYPKSWHTVVKRQVLDCNQIIAQECPGYVLVDVIPQRNPRSGRPNEVLYRIPHGVEVYTMPRHFRVVIGGDVVSQP